MIISTILSSKTNGKGASLLAFVVFLLALCASPCSGQVNVATINGIVFDGQGAAIPNAHVVLQNTATGLTRTASTDDSGHYSLQLVPIGDYQLTVTAIGFDVSHIERSTQMRATLSTSP